MANAKAIINVENIVLSDKARKYVIVSAAGKKDKNDTKITDILYKCAELYKTGGAWQEEFIKVKNRYCEIAKDLNIEIDLDKIFSAIQKEILLCNGGADYFASRGEYLSAVLFAKKINYPFIDAAELIIFDSDGKLDAGGTNKLASKALAKKEYAVIPGFYGRDKSGKIKTFSRGGSDITGAIIARAVKADVYENWTDVNGFMASDPRVVENPKQITELTYKELRELSYMGASVLHADSVFPVSKSNIPINIKNTFCPSDKGTFILPAKMAKEPKRIVTGIAGRKDYSVIFIEKAMMNSELGFARKVLSVFEREGISLEHMPTGIDTMSIIAETSLLNGKLDNVIKKIKRAVKPDSIHVEHEISLIATVGRGMANIPGTSARLFSAVAKAGVNIVMIDQGSCEINIILGIKNADYEKAVRAIYNEFFS